MLRLVNKFFGGSVRQSGWAPLNTEPGLFVDRYLLQEVEKELRNRYSGSIAQINSLRYNARITLAAITITVLVTAVVVTILQFSGVAVAVNLLQAVLGVVALPAGFVQWVLNRKLQALKALQDQPPNWSSRVLELSVRFSPDVAMLHEYLTERHPAYRTLRYAQKVKILRLFFDAEIEQSIYRGLKEERALS